MSVPMFPLPNVVLFPGTVLPLHIFEERYRQLVEDLLDRSGRMVIGNIVEQAYDQIAGNPPVHPVAGLGEIVRHRRLPDGRFLIWLFGLTRVRIDEVESDRLYRVVEAEVLGETSPEDAEDRELRPRLERAIEARVPDSLELPEEISLGLMTDVLVQSLGLTAESVQSLYSELCVSKRAEAALEEHDRLPLPDPPAKDAPGEEAAGDEDGAGDETSDDVTD